MKKILFSAIALVAMSMGISSCGSDNEDAIASGINNVSDMHSKLIGEWLATTENGYMRVVVGDEYLLTVEKNGNEYSDSTFYQMAWVNDLKTLQCYYKYSYTRYVSGGAVNYTYKLNGNVLSFGNESSPVDYTRGDASYNIKKDQSGLYVVYRK